jgi:hypothetical protein
MKLQRNKKTLAVLIVVGLFVCIGVSAAENLAGIFVASIPPVLLGWIVLWWFGG